MILLGIDFAKGTCRINTPCCIIYMIYILCHTNMSIYLILLAPKIFMTCDMTIYIVNLLHFPWMDMVMLVTCL